MGVTSWLIRVARCLSGVCECLPDAEEMMKNSECSSEGYFAE